MAGSEELACKSRSKSAYCEGVFLHTKMPKGKPGKGKSGYTNIIINFDINKLLPL